MDDRSSSLPDRAALGSRSALRALDGEVLPPKSRLKHAEAEAPPRASAPYKVRLSTAIAGLCALLVLGGAAGGAFYVFDMRAPAAKPDPTATALNRLQEDMGRLKAGVDTLHNGTEVARQEDAVRALKKSVDVLRAELDTLRTNNTSALNQLSAKLDKPDRDASPKLTDIAARLDRIEKQVSSPLATGSIAAPTRAASPAAAQQTIAVQTLDKPLPKPATLGNWIVRDVYDGIALVEGREGGVREVAPGEFLPGAGEVRSIERRGRAWIVVTSRGIIDNATW